MRCIIWSSCVILLVVLASGCLQPVPAPVPTPAPTLTPVAEVTLPPAATNTPALQKQVNVTATKTLTEVIVTYHGGPDAADLLALNIRINNQNSQNVQRTITGPEIGARYIFTYKGESDASVVNVVGQFRDGTEQTVLMAYV